MFTLFAHAGHVDGSEESLSTMSALDHCMPIIIGAGIVIAILIAIIVYLLTQWQPKKK